jgi:[lysine-biosynthesis-protein LysW]--L-2-aminoadipate ligase
VSERTPSFALLYDTIRWEEKAIVAAAEKKGVVIHLVDAKELNLDLNSKVTGVSDEVVLQRTVSHFRNLHSTAALEYAGHRVVNDYKSVSICGDKLFGSLELIRHGVPTPRTRLAFTEESALKAMDEVGYPVVLKPVVGSWGRLAALLRERDAAAAVLEDREYMFPLYQVYYVQEYVKRPPRDIRSFVVGGRTVAAIYRISSADSKDWRTNTARGGRAEACEVGKELDELSLKAAEASGAEIAGVDIMESEAGLVVHEVNGTTEFKNTVPATGVDIPGIIVDYLVSIQKR